MARNSNQRPEKHCVEPAAEASDVGAPHRWLPLVGTLTEQEADELLKRVKDFEIPVPSELAKLAQQQQENIRRREGE